MKEFFKKRVLPISGCTVLAMAFGMYLYNAFDDYGLRTITLDEHIAAQGEDTSGNTHGSGSVSCDGYNIYCSQTMAHDKEDIVCTSNREGDVYVYNIKMIGYKKNKTYTMSVTHNHCKECSDKRNMCDRREQGYEYISIREGADGSTGHSTSGDNTSRI